MTLACEDANFLRLLLLLMLMMRIVMATFFADLGAEASRFGHKVKILFRLRAQGLFKILKLNFRQDFEAGISLVFCH